MVAREGFRYAALLQQRHTKYGRIRGMVVGEGGRSTGVLLYHFLDVVLVIESDSDLYFTIWHHDHPVLRTKVICQHNR